MLNHKEMFSLLSFLFVQCNLLQTAVAQNNQTLHQYKERLHRLFSQLIRKAKERHDFAQGSRLKKMLRKSLDMVVQHQCQSAMQMIGMLKVGFMATEMQPRQNKKITVLFIFSSDQH